MPGTTSKEALSRIEAVQGLRRLLQAWLGNRGHDLEHDLLLALDGLPLYRQAKVIRAVTKIFEEAV